MGCLFSGDNGGHCSLLRMSLSKYGPTEETTNFSRLIRIIAGPCTDVLRDVLRKTITPSALSQNVKFFIAHLRNPGSSPFNIEQKTLIYNQNYSDFDITLLYVIFRNICNFKPHSKQWGNDPDPGERSVSANIERIRLIRNKYLGHYSKTTISNADFTKEYNNIFYILKDFDCYLGTSTVYQDAMLILKECSMDPKQEAKYIADILNVKDKLDSVSGNFILYHDKHLLNEKRINPTQSFPVCILFFFFYKIILILSIDFRTPKVNLKFNVCPIY